MSRRGRLPLIVAAALAPGKTSKEIAASLNISPRTAEFQKHRMMEQLKIKTSAELIQYALKEGMASQQFLLVNFPEKTGNFPSFFSHVSRL